MSYEAPLSCRYFAVYVQSFLLSSCCKIGAVDLHCISQSGWFDSAVSHAAVMAVLSVPRLNADFMLIWLISCQLNCISLVTIVRHCGLSMATKLKRVWLLQVTLTGGAEHPAKIVGFDEDRDVAVLQLVTEEGDQVSPSPSPQQRIFRHLSVQDLHLLLAFCHAFNLALQASALS